MIVPQQALEIFDNLGHDDAARDLFLGGNATRLFKLDPSMPNAGDRLRPQGSESIVNLNDSVRVSVISSGQQLQ